MSAAAAKKAPSALRSGAKAPSLACAASPQAAPTYETYLVWQKAFLELRAVFVDYKAKKHAAAAQKGAVGAPKDPSTIASRQEIVEIAAAIVATNREAEFLEQAKQLEESTSLELISRFDPALSVTEDSTLRHSVVDRVQIELTRIRKLAKYTRDAVELRRDYSEQKTSGSLEDWLKTRLLNADFK